jgi:hypothetical protein
MQSHEDYQRQLQAWMEKRAEHGAALMDTLGRMVAGKLRARGGREST